MLVDKDQGFLEVVSIENLNKIESTYNLTVADFHTYYVTKRNVLVHNSDCLDVPDFATDKLRWGKQRNHTRDTALEGKSYLNSMEDAQTVLNELVGRGGQILRIVRDQNRIYFKSEKK